MTTPEEEDRAARDAGVTAMLPLVAASGWNASVIAAGLRASGRAEAEAAQLFPRGALSAIAAWRDLKDRRMAEAAGDLSGLRTPGRIRALVAARLALIAPHKAAARRAASLLALPWNAPAALRCAAQTADAIWVAAGDASDDLSRYTRRATLAAILAATLAYFLRDDSADTGPALAFLDRRLADLARLQRPRRPRPKPEAA